MSIFRDTLHLERQYQIDKHGCVLNDWAVITFNPIEPSKRIMGFGVDRDAAYIYMLLISNTVKYKTGRVVHWAKPSIEKCTTLNYIQSEGALNENIH